MSAQTDDIGDVHVVLHRDFQITASVGDRVIGTGEWRRDYDEDSLRRLVHVGYSATITFSGHPETCQVERVSRWPELKDRLSALVAQRAGADR